MPVATLISVGWILDPPAAYRGAALELLQVGDCGLWALRVHRDETAELLFFPCAEALERHLRPDPSLPELFVAAERPGPKDG